MGMQADKWLHASHLENQTRARAAGQLAYTHTHAAENQGRQPLPSSHPHTIHISSLYHCLVIGAVLVFGAGSTYKKGSFGWPQPLLLKIPCRPCRP